MKIREYRNRFISELTALCGSDEAESFFYIVLDDFLGMKRVDLALNPDAVLSADDLSQWDFVLSQLKKEIPIQYILGKAHFFGMEFEVNDDVLIPRPETEELVEWIISDNAVRRSANPLKIIDIGTGSGCIAIALAKSLGGEVSALDVSHGALAMARRNAEKNGVSVNFIQKDILSTEDLGQEFDIIVSNPPYVRELEKHEIRRNVLDNEPHLALFVPDANALVFYEKIADLALKNLSPGGKLFFEINQYLGRETVEMLRQKGFGRVELRKDIYGNDRMVLAM